MIELFGQNIRTNRRQSSKGNQLKWENDGIWYKADYTGYEGLADDNGAGLLADTTMDYPLAGDIYTLMEKVQPKTICNAFDEQLDISESLYKMNLKFRFTKKDVTELLENAEGYSDEIRKRVETIIFAQMRKYPYLFSKT